MYAYHHSFLALAERKAQKFEFLRGVYFCNMALFAVHLQLQFPFQIADAAFKQSFRCTLAPAQQYDIIGIGSAAYFV